jgi:hypothetical protein
MLKMKGFPVKRKLRSECDGADPANLSKRYAFILPSTDGYIYAWNGSAWSTRDEPMFTFKSEFHYDSDGFHIDMDEAIERSGIRAAGARAAPPCRAGFLAMEVPAGSEFPLEVGAYASDERMLYQTRDRRAS